MRISEIKIDDSQTGYYWLQIYVKNQKEAFSVKHQILEDQAIRERLKKQITHHRQIVTHSSNSVEIMIHNVILEQLQLIVEGNDNYKKSLVDN
jgi:hypothetical protein